MNKQIRKNVNLERHRYCSNGKKYDLFMHMNVAPSMFEYYFSGKLANYILKQEFKIVYYCLN